jgi:pimeloyl-ACP methyl ester carboxylesterase
MTKSSFRLLGTSAVLLVALAFASSLRAQEVITPPQGKGHVVVFLSGMAGPKHDKALAEAIASLGYVVVVYDGRHMEGGFGQTLRTAIQNAQQTPNALPGKVALVGVSLGGGYALAFGSRWPDLVAIDIVWYPATGFVKRMPGFVKRITVPVLMFAGEADHYQDCCLIAMARTLAANATAAGVPFELVTYPGADHDFIKGGSNYNPSAYNDALDRTSARLKAAFAN